MCFVATHWTKYVSEVAYPEAMADVADCGRG